MGNKSIRNYAEHLTEGKVIVPGSLQCTVSGKISALQAMCFVRQMHSNISLMSTFSSTAVLRRQYEYFCCAPRAKLFFS